MSVFSKELRACLKEFDDISPRGDLYFSREAAESQVRCLILLRK
jgi:hypothetical protein